MYYYSGLFLNSFRLNCTYYQKCKIFDIIPNFQLWSIEKQSQRALIIHPLFMWIYCFLSSLQCTYQAFQYIIIQTFYNKTIIMLAYSKWFKGFFKRNIMHSKLPSIWQKNGLYSLSDPFCKMVQPFQTSLTPNGVKKNFAF